MACGLRVKQMAHICFFDLLSSISPTLRGNILYINGAFPDSLIQGKNNQSQVLHELWDSCCVPSFSHQPPPTTPPIPNPLKVPSQTRGQEGRRQEQVKAAVITSLLQLKFI